MKVKFLRNVSAAGIHYQAGSECDLPEDQAKALIVMNKATRCQESQAKVAEPAPQLVEQADQSKPKLEPRKGDRFKNKEK